MAILTISRQMCSLGDEIAEELSRKLGWELITRDRLLTMFFKQVANPHELHMLNESAKFYLNTCKNNCSFLVYLEDSLRQFVRDHSAILVGFGSQIIFEDDLNALHVRIIAPTDIRIARVKKQYHVADAEAEQILTTADKKHKKFVATVFGMDLTDYEHYNLTLNTAKLSIDECTVAIIAMLKERELRRLMKQETFNTEIIHNLTDRPVFKNPAEVEFAKILDMYQIEWKYEPKTFPIEWDAEGNVTLAFSPDFYLTQFDTYIELTTMNQKYVTLKNKKVKKLREIYPGTNVKIVYKKDFQSLIERFRPTGESESQS